MYGIAICYHISLKYNFYTLCVNVGIPYCLVVPRNLSFLQLLCLTNYQRRFASNRLVFCEVHALLSASAIALGLSSDVAGGCETLTLASL